VSGHRCGTHYLSKQKKKGKGKREKRSREKRQAAERRDAEPKRKRQCVYYKRGDLVGAGKALKRRKKRIRPTAQKKKKAGRGPLQPPTAKRGQKAKQGSQHSARDAQKWKREASKLVDAIRKDEVSRRQVEKRPEHYSGTVTTARPRGGWRRTRCGFHWVQTQTAERPAQFKGKMRRPLKAGPNWAQVGNRRRVKRSSGEGMHRSPNLQRSLSEKKKGREKNPPRGPTCYRPES